MITAIEISEAQQKLRQLENEYAHQGRELDPREVRAELEDLRARVMILESKVQSLCNAISDHDQALADKHGIKEEPPF